jgi:hypothetical protein
MLDRKESSAGREKAADEKNAYRQKEGGAAWPLAFLLTQNYPRRAMPLVTKITRPNDC